RKAFQMAKEDGIEIICSTPHVVGYQMNESYFDFIKRRQREARQIASEYGIQLAFGCELFLNESVFDCIEKKLFRSLNDSKYVLCEFDVRKDIHKIVDFNEYLYEILAKGYIPVIAHVERYFIEELDYEILDDWKSKGYVFQINRTSLLGLHGKRIEKNAKQLLKKGYVHIVSSDCHRASGHRISILSDVFLWIQKKYGKECAYLLCEKNPYYVLTNQTIKNMFP
ncbi:MAG: tyrosine-protein phosphatase, partial [Floccifex sp.]